MSRTALRLFVALFMFTTTAVATADVTMPKIFGDQMVLQRGKLLPVWGWAEPGEQVSVSLGGNSAVATTGADGRWTVTMPKLSASIAPLDITIHGANEIIIRNVLVGEVWICSGQSNMEWPLTRAANPDKEIAAADHPRIRLFTVKRNRVGAETPAKDVVGQWSVCSKTSVPGFSAVAYFFGRHLQKHLDVPVGLINTSWGGTPAEHWMPKAAFDGDPSLKETSDHPHAQNVMKSPSGLYNGMVAPLVPMAFRGVIWYQGESNVPMSRHYLKLFSAMITGWRQAWDQGDFPFLFVQIAPWDYSGIKTWPREGAPRVREAQLKTLALPNTGMVVTTDIGNVKNIHPINKQEVGRRLGLAARAIAHGEKIIYSGPLYKSIRIDGGKAVISFTHFGGGLRVKGRELTHFQIAGEDKQFVDATAKIEGNTVIVHSDKVSNPTAVRFGFSDIAEPNLFNEEGLPASPFRTDED